MMSSVNETAFMEDVIKLLGRILWTVWTMMSFPFLLSLLWTSIQTCSHKHIDHRTHPYIFSRFFFTRRYSIYVRQKLSMTSKAHVFSYKNNHFMVNRNPEYFHPFHLNPPLRQHLYHHIAVFPLWLGFCTGSPVYTIRLF